MDDGGSDWPILCSCVSYVGAVFGSRGDSRMPISKAVGAIHSEDTHEHLVIWGDWNRTDSPLAYSTTNGIHDMMQRAMEGTEREDPNTPDDFTFDIECTDKAIARLKLSRYDKRLIRVIKHWYLGYHDYHQIADTLKTSEDVVKMLHWAAVSCVGRFRFVVKKDLLSQESLVV